MTQHGKLIESVETCLRRALQDNSSRYNAGRGSYSMLNYKVRMNGTMVTLYHYNTVVAVMDIGERALIKVNATSRSDCDAINTAIYKNAISYYLDKERYPYMSYKKNGTCELRFENL